MLTKVLSQTAKEESASMTEKYALMSSEVENRWALQHEGQPLQKGDLEGVKLEYDQIHGFGFPSIDYSLDVDPRVI